MFVQLKQEVFELLCILVAALDVLLPNMFFSNKFTFTLLLQFLAFCLNLQVFNISSLSEDKFALHFLGNVKRFS